MMITEEDGVETLQAEKFKARIDHVFELVAGVQGGADHIFSWELWNEINNMGSTPEEVAN